MNSGIKRIYLSIEDVGKHPIDYENDNTDVIVQFQNGDLYVASFFAYKNLETLRVQHQKEDEFLKGKYFWADRMVFIENCKKETVWEVVLHLIEEGNFRKIFRKL